MNEHKITPNVYILENLFKNYNKRLFNNSLAMPTFKISNSKTIIGNFIYDYIGQNDNSIIIEISGRYKYTTYQLLSILVHEMIHYYMSAVEGINTENHGADFIRMADMVNENGNFHVTPLIDLSAYEAAQDNSSIGKICNWLFG